MECETGSRMMTLMLVFLLALAGCSNAQPVEKDEPMEQYQIKVDSLVVPMSAGATDTIEVAVHCLIGPNACYGFDRADLVNTPEKFEMTFFGLHDTESMCAQVLVEWRGKIFSKPPPHGDEVEFVVHQPDGSTLKERVRIDRNRD